MGLFDALKDQFLDVIEYVADSNKLIVSKYQRESGNNELKQGVQSNRPGEPERRFSKRRAACGCSAARDLFADHG